MLLEAAEEKVIQQVCIVSDRNVAQSLMEVQAMLIDVYTYVEGEEEQQAILWRSLLEEASARAPNAERINAYFAQVDYE
jgi:hypothetical protein